MSKKNSENTKTTGEMRINLLRVFIIVLFYFFYSEHEDLDEEVFYSRVLAKYINLREKYF